MAVKITISYDVLKSGAVRGRMMCDGQKFSYTSKVRLPKGSVKEDITDVIRKEVEKEIIRMHNSYIKKGAPSRNMRCEDWCEYWLVNYKKPIKSEENAERKKVDRKGGGRVTMPSYNRLWQTYNLIKSCDSSIYVLKKQLKDVTKENILSIITELEERDISVSSLRKVKDFFGASFTVAKSLGYMVENPCSSVSIKSDSEVQNEELVDYIPAKYFEDIVTEALRKKADGTFVHQYGAGVVLQLMTGCRCGEIRSLAWDDVYEEYIHIGHSCSLVNDLDEIGVPIKGKQHVYISMTKNKGSIRDIPFEKGDIISKCLEILKERCETDVKNTSKNSRSLVMPTSTGWYIALGNYNKYVKRIVEFAIPESDMSSHKLRHSFISLLVNDKKADIPAVARMVGHMNTRVTYHYANHTDDEKKRNTLALATRLVSGLVAEN